jgi:hypothetical protein
MSTHAGMHRMIKKSLDQGCREINKLSTKLFISIIFNKYYLLDNFQVSRLSFKMFEREHKILYYIILQ